MIAGQRNLTLLGRAALALAGVTAAYAHYTWIAPAAAPLQIGRQGMIQFCHGHEFPAGEETLGIQNAYAWMFLPSGKQFKLSLVTEAKRVVSAFTPRETGVHRAVYTQDRGVQSRTPNGMKPGGRTRNPDAAQAFRSYRSAVAYLPVGGSNPGTAKPTGIELEIVAVHRDRVWELQLLKNGKPQAGVPIEVRIEGASGGFDAGKTDADGRRTYRTAEVKPGRPMLFFAEWKDAPPAGSDYETVNYSTSLFVRQ
jgi:uncharacterized GH25 family protein